MKLMKTTVAASFAILALSGGAHAATYKLATNLPDQGAPAQLLAEFTKNVDQRTQGRVKFKIFPNAVLGDQVQYFAQIQKGVVDAGWVSSPVLENIVPAYAIFGMPYMFRSGEEFKKVLVNPDIQKLIADESAKKNFYPLGAMGTAARSVYSSKPIRTVEDLKGKKLRCQSSQTFVETVKLLGGIPTPMAYAEVYTAIQTGVIDGAEGGLSGLWDSKLGEVAKYAVRTEHARVTDYVVVSEKLRNKLSKEDLAIVQDEFNKISAKSIELSEKVDDENLALAVKNFGVTVSTIDTAPLQKIVQPIYDKAMVDPEKAPLLKAVFKITDRKI